MPKLNLLPHKSWNVYSSKNRERVRRDEERAAREQDLARLGASGPATAMPVLAEPPAATAPAAPQDPLDELFESIAPGGPAGSGRGSAARPSRRDRSLEREQRREQRRERPDPQSGVPLGETYDGKKAAPWYASLDFGTSARSEAEKPHERERRERLDRASKRRLDPAAEMAEYLALPKPAAPAPRSSGPKTIEELRQERLDREAAERRREQSLLAQHHGLATRHDRDGQYYNSQFNPQLVRRRPPQRPPATAAGVRFQPY
ncbi:hypothetical protein HK105_203340 [Polyrhizophydium stewartii]|uniref:CBF1-interacting co-repressor CIR N-terminal domain-containing protein n=1 Tax=Polyrhizophydium stewartii TaxID=2732419 RepID=A0ABR4NCK8_9FUNG